MRAADAGKHVLCEKPAARTAAETARMIDHCVERGVVWMEAFMYRFHPQWRLVFDQLRDNAIGELRTVRSVFTFTVRDPENIRRQRDLGGEERLQILVHSCDLIAALPRLRILQI
jgi:predicted dehydrogenase